MADAALAPPMAAQPNGVVPSPQSNTAAPLVPAPDGDVTMQNGPLVNGDEAEAEGLPAEANETIYLNNLNERVKPDGAPSLRSQLAGPRLTLGELQ